MVIMKFFYDFAVAGLKMVPGLFPLESQNEEVQGNSFLGKEQADEY